MRKLTYLLFCLVLGIGLANAQTTKVTGTVISADDNEPIVGASVVVKGSTTIGTVTDFDGMFSLDVPSSAKTLVVSYVGMESQDVSVKPMLKIIMRSSSEALDEVVVTGYGVTKKAAFTGAASIISASSISKLNDSNPIKALEGSVPGLQMNIGSGQPGAPANIFIRGKNSFNSGTQPLYIIDGIPFNADPVGVRASEEQTMSPLSTLNPSDIESMTVLKDATATSIYGARAANGVIVINTKKGKGGKVSVNFTAKVGMETMPTMPSSYKPLDGPKYKELSLEALSNDYKTYGTNGAIASFQNKYGLDFPYTSEGFSDFFDWYVVPVPGANTDWLKEVTQNGLIQEYGVDVQSGGTDGKTPKYFLSFNYFDNQSIVKGKDLSRYSLRFNFEHAPSKFVKFGLNTNLSYTESNMGAGGGYFTDPITQAYMQSPLHPVVDANGNWFFDTVNGYNPVAQRSKLGDKSTAKQYRAIISPSLQLNFTDNLFFISRAGADFYFVDEFGYWSFLQPQGKDMRGMGENNYSTRVLLSITNTLNYINTFNEKHNVNFLIGQEGQRTNLKEAYLAGSNYPVDYLDQVANSAVPGSAATYKYNLLLASFFLNAQYDYDNKYYLSGSFRYDASSRFGSNNRWAPFWSLGAKYRISNEAFMESTKDWLNNLTIRTSYGTSGNQEVGDVRYSSPNSWYTSRDLYDFGYNYNGSPGSGRMQSGNPNLRWEQTGKFNVGVDFSFLDRFSIEADYYNHLTKDMVFAVPVSMITGLSSNYKNVGELSNQGIEFTLNAQLINNKSFKWNVAFTGSKNINEVKKLSTDAPIETSIAITEVGQPLYSFKMKEWAGVDPETGDGLWYLNENGSETTSDYNEAEKRYLGSANPKFQGSFSNTMSWKGIDFSFQLNYSLGAKIYGSNLRYDEQVGGGFGQNFTNWVYENRWQNKGDIAKVPKLMFNDGRAVNLASSRFLMNGNYLKLRSITLGYTFPKSISSKMYMSNLRIFANADNLFTVTAKDYRGFDPSGIGADGVQWWNFPVPRNFMFGLSVGF